MTLIRDEQGLAWTLETKVQCTVSVRHKRRSAERLLQLDYQPHTGFLCTVQRKEDNAECQPRAVSACPRRPESVESAKITKVTSGGVMRMNAVNDKYRRGFLFCHR